MLGPCCGTLAHVSPVVLYRRSSSLSGHHGDSNEHAGCLTVTPCSCQMTSPSSFLIMHLFNSILLAQLFISPCCSQLMHPIPHAPAPLHCTLGLQFHYFINCGVSLLSAMKSHWKNKSIKKTSLPGEDLRKPLSLLCRGQGVA